MQIGETCSAMLKTKIHPKLKDLGYFTIPCSIGNIKNCKAMLDLRDSINFMPYSFYTNLTVGYLKKTNVVV
ncbi:hypothetical protein REPUB_Repub02eG0173400 [Reevesia pubescens]